MPRFTLTTSLVAVLSSLTVSIASADRAVESQAPAPYRSRSEPPVQGGAPLPVPHFAQPPGGASRVMRRRAPMLDRETIRAKLIENRAANLERFRAYQEAGVFPSNVYKQGLLNVWRDQAGHLCAAATIIKASGADELVDRVADQTNFIKLGDVKQGPLMDWILTSGFTQDEIAAIQLPYQPVTEHVVRRPDPERRVAVDPDMRRAETLRLARLYKQVDAMIVKNAKHSIELAVDRLMKRQDLAWQLVD